MARLLTKRQEIKKTQQCGAKEKLNASGKRPYCHEQTDMKVVGYGKGLQRG